MRVTSTISPLLKIGIGLLGIWPNMRYASVYRLIYMLSILLVQYFQYLHVFAHFKLDDLALLSDSLPAALDYTLSIFKLIGLWVNRRVFYEMLADMDEDWRLSMHVEQHLHLMTEKANISHLFFKTVLSFTTVAGILYLLGDYSLTLFHLESSANVSSRQFPMKVLIPFEYADKTPIYEILFIILCVHGMMNGYAIIILDAMMLSLVLHVCSQIDIICHEFKSISGGTPFVESSASLGMLIEKHNRVITFSSKLQKISSFIALMLLLCNTLVFVYLGYLTVISIHGNADMIKLLKAASASNVVMVEIFIFCFVGEYLSHKSKSIAEAAYNSSWYDMSPSQGKTISIMIMRSQKQITLTAGGFANLSLETFATFIKSSGSYISVMLAMY